MHEYEMLKEVIDSNNSSSNSLTITLIILIVINIIVEIIRHRGLILLSNREKSNKRQLLIEEKKLKVLETLFQSLDNLTLYDKSEELLLLTKVKEINLYVRKNKIYLTKNFQNATQDILDYFKNVIVDYQMKSAERELKLLENFCNEFNK